MQALIWYLRTAVGFLSRKYCRRLASQACCLGRRTEGRLIQRAPREGGRRQPYHSANPLDTSLHFRSQPDCQAFGWNPEPHHMQQDKIIPVLMSGCHEHRNLRSPLFTWVVWRSTASILSMHVSPRLAFIAPTHKPFLFHCRACQLCYRKLIISHWRTATAKAKGETK
jgi:hypothetical protein